ncbi:MAG: Crp/Fnr family transcriptional regulator [Rikenellaceae bacterium]
MDNLDFNFFCRDCKKSDEYKRVNCFVKYRVRKFDKGDHIAFKGDRVEELGVLTQGQIRVSFVLETGLVIRSMLHEAPYPIGAVALFSKNNRYRVDIDAIEKSAVVSVPREEVERQMIECRDFMRSYIDYATSRLDMFTEHLSILAQRSIKSKLAYYILICSDGKQYRFSKNIKDLADYLCVERPSLSRVIAQFVASGIITYDGKEGKILDSSALKEFVE